MANVLRDFWMLYLQDFDLVFEKDTDPIDIFCDRHDRRDQQELLRRLTEFHAEVHSGRRSVRDLVGMGLEYWPGDEQHPETWMPRLIRYLEAKIQNSPGLKA